MALVGNISGSSAYSSNIGISGSVVIANRPDALFPTLGSVGADVVFFVSGSRGGKGVTAQRSVSVFGGDAVVSGSLTIGTGSVTITSNDVQFNAFDTRIQSGSGGLTFFDAGNTGGITLSSLVASSGDVVGPASATDNAIARFDLTTGKLLQNSDITISDPSGGSVTVNTVASTTVNLLSATATTVNFAGAASTLAIGTAGGSTTMNGNVTITGDLTVDGTTTTINTQNLLVEDPVIYFGSGSVGVNRNGGIALASGSSVTDQALVWGRVADDTWGAGRLDVTNGTSTNLTGMSLLPVRASKFELGGSTAFVTSSDGISILLDAGTGTVNVGSSNNAKSVNIGTGAAAHTVTVGSTASTSALTLDAGTGTINIGNSNSARTVNVGTGLAAQTVTVGSADTTSTLTLKGGTAVSLTGATATNFLVGIATGTGTITLGQSNATNTISIGAGAYADGATQSINIGNGTLAGTTGRSVVTIGNSNAATAVNITAGTGNVSIGGAVTTNYTVGTTTGTGIITLGRSTDSNTISIGNGNTADTKTQTINIGAGTPVSTGKAVITIGNTNGASKIDLKAGSDNIVAWAHLVPNTDRGFDLGSPTARWNNIYTGDLHLRNERGDYTLIEEEDFLTIRFNKTGKRYKFLLEPVPELDEK